MTKIVAVRSAFPANRYSQAEITRKFAELADLTPAQIPLLERLHGNAWTRPGWPPGTWTC